jgi:hypothetical protein
MADDKKDDNPKYNAAPRTEIPPQTRKAQFSSDGKDRTTTLLGIFTQKDRDKK